MRRALRTLLIGLGIALCWWGMMAVHEAGHVAHAWLSGGTVTGVYFRLLDFSRTDVMPNPHPVFVVWGGFVWGCLIPLGVWLGFRLVGSRYVSLAEFFAGFCLIANGAYWAAGAFYPAGDTADLLRYGCSRWLLAVVGLPAVAAGLWLWHRVGLERRTHHGGTEKRKQ